MPRMWNHYTTHSSTHCWQRGYSRLYQSMATESWSFKRVLAESMSYGWRMLAGIPCQIGTLLSQDGNIAVKHHCVRGQSIWRIIRQATSVHSLVSGIYGCKIALQWCCDWFEYSHLMGWFRVECGQVAHTIVRQYVSIRLSETVCKYMSMERLSSAVMVQQVVKFGWFAICYPPCIFHSN